MIRLASVLEKNKKKVLVCIATSSNIEHVSMTTRLGETRTLWTHNIGVRLEVRDQRI
jgi:hypothetical protein